MGGKTGDGKKIWKGGGEVNNENKAIEGSRGLNPGKMSQSRHGDHRQEEESQVHAPADSVNLDARKKNWFCAVRGSR